MAEPLTKLTVARAQLITALDLFVRDKDPIAVHCLACGGGEVIEGLAEAQNQEVFANHILKNQPNTDRKGIRGARNQYWNAFKHFSDRKSLARDDEELLDSFDDRQNDTALFIGWWDYMLLRRKLPVPAQVFQAWWYSLNEDKIEPGADLSAFRLAFPYITKVDRAEQKRRLRRAIEKWRHNKEILADPATES